MALGTLQVYLSANTKRFERAMKRARRKLKQFARGIKQFASLATKAFAVVGGIVAFKLAKSFVSFDKAMTNSLSIMKGVTPQLRKEMEGVARTISTKTTFSATELGEAYFFLASAGLDAQQSMKSLGTVANFAQAGNFNLTSATDLLTDAQSALGLTVKDSTQNMENMLRVSDVLVKANTLANASVEQFSLALTNKAGPALRNSKISIEEGVAVLSAFADQGIKAEKAGTALSVVLRELQNKSITQKKAFDKLGVSIFKSDGSMRNMGVVVANLENKLGGLSVQQQKTELLALGFSAKSVGFVQSLIGMSDKIKGYETELRKAGGTTKDVADKQLKSFSAQMTLLWNNVDALVAKLLNMGDAMPKLVSKLQEFTKFVQEHGEEWVNTAKIMWIEFKFAWEKIVFTLGSLFSNLSIQLNWFADNWKDLWWNNLSIIGAVFKDIWKFASSNFVGIIKFVTELFKGLFNFIIAGITDVWNFIKSGFTADFGTAISKSVATSLKNMGKLAKDTFVNSFATIGEETEKAIGKAGIPALKVVGFGEIADGLEEIEKRKLKAIADFSKKLIETTPQAVDKALGKKAKGEGDGADPKTKRLISNNFAGAVQKGSVEAYRMEISRNKQSPEAETAKSTKKLVELQTKTLAEAKKQNERASQSMMVGAKEFAIP